MLGLIWIVAAEYAAPLPPGTTSVPPWKLAWWTGFGWGNGLFLSAFGVAVLIFRAATKRRVLFGDRIRREYK